MTVVLELPGLCKTEGPFWSDNFTIYNTVDPDFTVCFQYSVLEWIPSAWVFFVCLAYLWLDRRKPKTSRRFDWARNKFNIFKIIVTLCLAALALATAILYLIQVIDGSTGAVVLLGSALSSVAYLIVGYIVHWEYRRAVNSSGPVFLFWLLRLLCTVVQAQSALRGSLQSQPAHLGLLVASLGLLAIQFVAHCFADNTCGEEQYTAGADEETPLLHSKGNTKAITGPQIDSDHNPCPLKTSSFLNRLSFYWYSSLVLLGWKSSLSLKDCWNLPDMLTTRYLTDQLSDSWEQEVQKAKAKSAARKAQGFENPTYGLSSANATATSQSGSETTFGDVKPSLVLAFLRVVLPRFLISACYRLVFDGLTLVQPIMLNLLINCITGEDPIAWHGYVIAAIIFAICVTRSAVNGQHRFIEWLYHHRCSGSLGGLIFRKSLKLTPAARKDFTAGEVINLVAVDVDHVGEASYWMHMMYSAPLTIGVALYQLWLQLGIASLTALIIILVFVPFNFFLAMKAVGFQEKQMTTKDSRLKQITELINGIKVLKLYGWEASFANMINQVRKLEVSHLRKMLNSIAGLHSGFDCAPLLITVCTILVYVLSSSDNVLDPARVFVSLQLISIINEPLACFPIMLAVIGQATVSLVRLHKFMLADEIPENVVVQSSSQAEAIRFENANLSWDRTVSTPVLKNLNVALQKSSLIAVVGRVGDGKSSFLNAIIGEMHKISGEISVNGEIAYVPQQAWIVNATVKENIVFGQTFSPQRYEEVLRACALQPDLKILANGDMTEIGDRGINLSGGQKQRISLARATYQRNASIYLLDDPLSAVDAHVGRHLFEQVIGPYGILANKCRVLVTNALFALPSADYIIMLNEGEVAEMGTYDELLEKRGSFAKLIEEYLEEAKQQEETEQDVPTELDKAFEKPRLDRVLSRTSESKASLKKIGRGESVIETFGKLVEEEDMEEGQVSAKVYFSYIKAMGVPMAALSFTASAGLVAAMVVLSWWLSVWSEDVYKFNETDFREQTLYRITVYSGIGAAEVACIIIRSFSMAFGMARASEILHKVLLARIIRAPMSFFDVTPIGRLTNRFSHDIDAVDTRIPDTLPFMTYEVVLLLSIVCIIIVSAPVLVAIVIPILIAYYFAYKFYISTIRQLKRLQSIMKSPVLAHYHCSHSGITSIRAHKLQTRFNNDLLKVMDDAQKPYFAVIAGNRWIVSVLEVLNNILVLVTCMFAVASGDFLTPGLASLMVTYPLQLTECAQYVLTTIGDMESYMVAVERIQEYSRVPNEAPLEVEHTDRSLASNWPTKGAVEFRDYSVRYRPGLDLVLRNIKLQVQAGERVGIVGRTGAGKSSLSLALFRLIEPANGTIYIDGVDIRYMGLQRLRTRLTIIPQEPVLFTGPLRVNLDPLNAHSDDEVWTALENAHLKTFVSALQGTLQYECAEGGENLSVGQRQLLCLARALLRKTKILVLDEATAAVDVETDELIQRTIREKFGGCTVLTIAHRLNTIMDYDKVLVLDNGEVKEFSTPTSLMQDQNSMFNSLARDAGMSEESFMR